MPRDEIKLNPLESVRIIGPEEQNAENESSHIRTYVEVYIARINVK
jgi:hypothetical protein